MKFVNNFLQETNKNLVRHFEIRDIHFLRKEQNFGPENRFSAKHKTTVSPVSGTSSLVKDWLKYLVLSLFYVIKCL